MPGREDMDWMEVPAGGRILGERAGSIVHMQDDSDCNYMLALAACAVYIVVSSDVEAEMPT